MRKLLDTMGQKPILQRTTWQANGLITSEGSANYCVEILTVVLFIRYNFDATLITLINVSTNVSL